MQEKELELKSCICFEPEIGKITVYVCFLYDRTWRLGEGGSSARIDKKLR